PDHRAVLTGLDAHLVGQSQDDGQADVGGETAEPARGDGLAEIGLRTAVEAVEDRSAGLLGRGAVGDHHLEAVGAAAVDPVGARGTARTGGAGTVAQLQLDRLFGAVRAVRLHGTGARLAHGQANLVEGGLTDTRTPGHGRGHETGGAHVRGQRTDRQLDNGHRWLTTASTCACRWPPAPTRRYRRPWSGR